MDISELKEQVFTANMALVEHGLVIFTFGNVSGIDRERGVFAIKPSGVDYERLTAEDIVLCDMDGNPVDDGMRPSSDTKTHAVLYKSFPEIGGIAHTHSTTATAWAQACRDIPCFGTTHADCMPGAVPCTRPLSDSEINGDYENETGNVIVERMQGLDPAAFQMILVASHGPFTWGADALKAVENSAMLEELAAMALMTVSIDSAAAPVGRTLLDKHYQRKHGKQSYYGQE